MYIRIGVTKGLRGFFAVSYDNEGPICSSPLSFEDYIDAVKDAIEWAKSEYDKWELHVDKSVLDYYYKET